MPVTFGAGAGFADRKKPIPYTLPQEDMEYFFNDYNPPYNYLYAQLYKFGQRVSEALATKTSDITFEHHGGKEVMVLNSLTEKNKAMPFRVLPCAVDDMLSQELAEHYREASRGELYNGISRQAAYNALSKEGKQLFTVKALVPHREGDTAKAQWTIEDIEYCMHPHYLRHCCLTHKVLHEGYDLVKLMQFAGWSSPAPAMRYIHLNWRELLNG